MAGTIIKKNDIYDITIDGMTTEGNGVGRIDGYPVFVPFTCIGDKLQVIIVKALNKYGFGKIKKIYEPSERRIDNDCSTYVRCGGCCFRHVSYEEECKYKEDFVRNNLRKIGKIETEVLPIIKSPSSFSYRNKAQYPVREQNGEINIGFFAKRTHDVIPSEECKLHPDFFKNIIMCVKTFMEDNHIQAYNELSGKGVVRHIFIRNAEQTGEVMVCLVINALDLEHKQQLTDSLLNACPNISSIILNINTKRDNVILGSSCKTIYGKDYITDILRGVKINISAMSFYQVNKKGAENLYKCAEDFACLKGDETLLDLYCGAGTIGLSMATKVRKLIGVEIVPEAIEDAKINAQINGIHNAEFICSDAGGAAKQLAENNVKPDVIIVDPPRKGCSIDVIDAIEKMSPTRLVMVSCDSATMARDCALLIERGYEIEKVQPVDMFPRTSHVETVCLLNRIK